MQLEFKTIEGGLFIAGLTLRELLELPLPGGAIRLRLKSYEDIEPLEKKAKAHGLKLAWSGGAPLELPADTLLKLFGDDKWSTLELEAARDDPGRPPFILSGWENRYWKLQGDQRIAELLPAMIAPRLALAPARAAEIAGLCGEWLESGVYLRALPDGSLKIAAMLRARSRVFLGLAPEPARNIRLRTLKAGDTHGVVTRVSLLSILTFEQALYDQLALGAALLFLLAALVCAGFAVLAWKKAWPVTGVLFALGFIFSALYGLRLAGARED